MAGDESKDFFISYNKADRGWAEWIAWQLEAEGYSTIIQAWDFRPGGNFVLQMNEATKHAKRTIAVLSPSYLASLFTQPEWVHAFADDPTGTQGKLLPIRVRDCVLEGLLKQIVYIDLVGLDGVAAGNALREGVRQSRALPSIEPLFPRDVSSSLSPVSSFPGRWPEIWRVPYPRNPFFTGREDLLTYLHEQLSTTKLTVFSQIKAISGLGGIGKTQIALEYAYRYGQEYRYVFWVSAETEETLLAKMVQLAVDLQIPGHDSQNQQKTIEVFIAWLVRERDWLLILDNADDLEMASKYLPQTSRSQGHVLLTTRASTGGVHIQIIEVEKMDQDEGILLLLRRAYLLANDTPLFQVNQQDRADAQAIVNVLDSLPLALDQAGAYIEEMQTTLADYLALYQTRRKDLLSQRGTLSSGSPDTVVTTWNLSFQQVEQVSSEAADLLRLCAFLAPDDIPETILTEGGSALRETLAKMAADPFQLNAAIRTLRRYSLVRRNPKTSTLSLHRLVQAVLQDAMSMDEQRVWAEQAVYAIHDVFPSKRWLPISQLLPHALACANLINHYQLTFPEAGYLLGRTAIYLQDAARSQEAETLYQHALAIYEKTLGSDHSETAATLNNLAGLYRDQGRFWEAEPLFLRASAIYEKTLGSEHPERAATLNDLAGLYHAQGRFRDAEVLYQRVLTIYERTLRSEQPEIATTLNNLALLYQDQRSFREAELLLQRALVIREKTLGSEHPDTSNTLNNLALLYNAQERYQEAELFFLRALDISEKALGPNHPHTAAILNDLAEFYRDQHLYTEAEQILRRASTIPRPTKLFFCYTLKDKAFRDQLVDQLSSLRYEGIIDVWYEREITTSTWGAAEVDRHINSAQIILALVSDNFVSSNYVFSVEMRRALERHEKGEARFIPVILRPVDWQETIFGKLQPLPRGGKAIVAWKKSKEAWLSITDGIKLVRQELQIWQKNTIPNLLEIRNQEPRQRFKLYEVFVKSDIPNVTFVERDDFSHLKLSLYQPSRCVVIEGPSGIGKTTALNKAIDEIILRKGNEEPRLLSARIKEHRNELQTLLKWHEGTVIIDDFHRLDAVLRAEIVDYLKYLADTKPLSKKLVIVGIPQTGQTLVDTSPDVATRIDVFKLGLVKNELVMRMIEAGEKALNIEFERKSEIALAASGSLNIAQYLCYNICSRENIIETQESHRIINCDIDSEISIVVSDLSRKFSEPIRRLAVMGGYRDLTCLRLLENLAESDDGYLSLPILQATKPDLARGIEHFISNGWMAKLYQEYPKSENYFFFNQTTYALVVDDPQLTFYLRKMSFPHLTKEIGKIALHEQGKVFISYSHKDIQWLERLKIHLAPIERAGLIDLWDDTRISAGERWRDEIHKAVEAAIIAIVLVSADFLASEFISVCELPQLLQRANVGGTTILSVIVSPCLFSDSGLDVFQSINPVSKSLVSMSTFEHEQTLLTLALTIKNKLRAERL